MNTNPKLPARRKQQRLTPSGIISVWVQRVYYRVQDEAKTEQLDVELGKERGVISIHAVMQELRRLRQNKDCDILFEDKLLSWRDSVPAGCGLYTPLIIRERKQTDSWWSWSSWL